MCPTLVTCWPHKAGRKLCAECLHAARRKQGALLHTIRPAAKRDPRIQKCRNTQYRLMYRPDHPDASKAGMMLEHRLVMEGMLGRRLTPAEVVHHRDHDGLNNAPENLELISDKGEHLAREHCMEGVAARMAGYPICACGARTEYNSLTCWACWKKSQTCPTCGREGRKMARRDMCHACYKNLRRAEGRLHRPPKANSGACVDGR